MAQTAFDFNSTIRSLSVSEGLPQGAVSGIAQDNRGFIWIASEGLSRYDGRNFIHFRHVASDTSSLGSNYIQFMRLDAESNLWLIHMSGEVDVFNTITTRVRHISSEKNFGWLTLKPNDSYFIAHEGGQYFAAGLTRLIKFDPGSSLKVEIKLPPGEKLLAMGTNHLNFPVASTNKALYEIRNTQLRKITDFPKASAESEQALRRADSFRISFPGRILETKNGILFIPGVGFVYVFEPKSRTIKSIPLENQVVSWGMVQTNGDAYAIAEDGLIRIDQQGNKTEIVKSRDLQLTNILLVDQSGILWSATRSALGIRLFNLRPRSFHSQSYTSGFLYDALERWLHPPMKNTIALGSYAVRCAKDRNGGVWVISNLYVEKKRADWPTDRWPGSGVYQLTKDESMKLPFNQPGKITNITFDDSNQCWLTIWDTTGKLVKCNVLNGKVTQVANIPNIITENWFLTTVGNKICVTTENALRLYDPALNTWTIIPKEKLGSSDMILMALPDTEDRQVLWIATKGAGIVRLNIETQEVTHYTESNGIPNNTVYYMARDKHGYFWCSCNKGIFRFNPSSGKVTSFYTARDGLQGNEFNRYHFIETPDGHFIFGGTEGYTTFHPDSVWTDHFQTPVIISGVLINNQPLGIAIPQMRDSLTSNLQRLVLSHDQNSLSISFAGLQYDDPEKLHYRYQLAGLENGWVTTEQETSAKYVNVPPGNYTFRVNASNSSGEWSNQIHELQIIIRPPLWKTFWAYALYVILSIVLGYVLYSNWMNRTRDRQRIILQQKEAEQLKALDEMKSSFFNNITHEFRTPLSLIIAPVEQMQLNYSEPELRQQLYGVQRNAEQLLHLVSQILDMAKLEAGNMPISFSRGNINEFLEGIVATFRLNATIKNLQLTCDLTGGQDMEHAFDADKLHKIIQNLLSNAIKFTPPGGYVIIRTQFKHIDDSSDQLWLFVEDSGVGVSSGQLPHLFTRFYQADEDPGQINTGSGIGLALVKELTQLMNGTITASNNELPSKGMLFTLSIPVKKALGNEVILRGEDHRNFKPVLSEVNASVPTIENGHSTDQPLVLVTEDHEELRNFICRAFGTHYRVISASNGKEGWLMAQKELPDLIISDVMMADGDGIEFCRKVKSTNDTSHIAFIMLTAKSSQASVMEGLESRADDYISKPFHLNELQRRVINILDRQQKLRHVHHRQLTEAEQPLKQEDTIDPFLQKVYEQVEKNLDNSGFTVDLLAASVAVSNRTLVRKLNAIAAITPSDLIKNYRLKKAAELLKENKPVSEVAWSVGFETSNYFSTAFKTYYGVKPSEYGKPGIEKG